MVEKMTARELAENMIDDYNQEQIRKFALAQLVELYEEDREAFEIDLQLYGEGKNKTCFTK